MRTHCLMLYWTHVEDEIKILKTLTIGRQLSKRAFFYNSSLEVVMVSMWLMSDDTALLFNVYVCPAEVEKKSKLSEKY